MTNTIENIITKALYNTDPATTYCVENELTDEYSTEANLIATLLDLNHTSLTEAAHRVFEKTFSGHYDHEKLASALNNIKKHIDTESV